MYTHSHFLIWRKGYRCGCVYPLAQTNTSPAPLPIKHTCTHTVNSTLHCIKHTFPVACLRCVWLIKMVLSKLFLALSLCVIVEIGLSVPTDADAVRDKRWDSCPHPGCKGSKGARGDRGPMGPMGYVGLRGPPGYCDPKVCYDFVHDHLPKGGPIQSDPGDPGLPGPKGDPGPPGPQGFSGLPGRDGADGPPGPRGPIGPPGKNGIDGEDGADGIPGTPGKDGDPGSKGLPGMKGMPGKPGAPGDPGSKGIPGDDGDTGPKGDKGDPGMQGRKGVPGVDGTPGEKGNPGSKGIPGLPGADGQKGEQGQDGKDGMKGGRGPPGPPIDVIPIGDSESCTKELQGVIRFDPITAQLYFCNGTQWICIVSQQCGGGPTCPSPFGQQNLGDEWYQIFTRNVTLETQDAADIVLLIDDSGSMNREHEWLLAMVPNLEAMLVQAGVGDGAEPNRYCAISFGGFGDRTMASFLLPEPDHCFSADRFPEARAELKNSGITEDGYQAIDFAIRNVPFRKSPFIAKNILLVTDEGRHVLPIAENITREVIKGELMDNDILLNVVVWAFLNLTNGDTDAVVMGQNASITYIVEPNGAFSTTTNEAIVTSSETNTVTAYFDLALEVGGASWSLPVLRESSATSNIPLQQSFTNALTELKVQEIKTAIESCRRCVCASPDGGLTAEVICSSADNQEFCKCVANSSTGREADCLGLGRRRR